MKLETRGITKSFDGTRIIEDISITLKEGELVCLLGVSGGGKTTLFNIIAGLSQPDSGQVLIDGEDVTGKPGHVSYMLQKDLLLPFRKVADNVALPLELAGTDRKAARVEAMRYFEQFGLQGTEDRYPAQLSGGMRQRAALLRTYLFGKSVALLDEPFSALDPALRQEMLSLVADVCEQQQLTLLMVSHSVEDAARIAPRSMVVAEGRIVWDGATAELLSGHSSASHLMGISAR